MTLPSSFRTGLRRSLLAVAVGTVVSGMTFSSAAVAQERELLNSSYDIARELFAAINPEFRRGGKRSMAKRSPQPVPRWLLCPGARHYAGLRADVVTFNQVTDVQALAMQAWWPIGRMRLRTTLRPTTPPPLSWCAKATRKASKAGMTSKKTQMVFPNPKTSGNGRYTYLAAWGFAENEFDGDEEKIQDFMRTFLRNVAVFDTGGRDATTSFIERGIGDVLISFESEVNNIRSEYGSDDYEVIVPPVSILWNSRSRWWVKTPNVTATAT